MKKFYLLLSLMLLALVLLCACAHEHSYEETYSSDAYYHWHASSCGHEEEISDYAVHTMDMGTQENGKTVYTCTVCAHKVNAEALCAEPISVSLAHSFAPRGSLVLVEGYFAGVAESSGSSGREILLRDTEGDVLIAVRGLPASYGSWPQVGYEKGDLVRLYATVKDEIYNAQKTDSQNRRCLVFSERNGTLSSTVVSKNHSVAYAPETVVTLDSHEDFKAFFDMEKLEAYTYVRIRGGAYLYATVGEFRPHMNGLADKESALLPDGKRAVIFKENALLANIGDAWDEYFAEEWTTVSSAVSLGRLQEVDIVAVYTGASDKGFYLTVLDEDWLCPVSDTIEIHTPQDALYEMALAYLRKGGLLEYDQLNGRRMVLATPEQATAQSYVFLDCSSYVTSIYYNTYGVKVIPDSYGSQNTKNYAKYAKENYGTAADVIGYYETLDYKTEEAQRALLDAVRETLMPGDVLVYRRGSKKYGADYSESNLSGHALIYMGDGMFTHSSGTSWNDSGTLLYKENPEAAKDRATREEYYNGTVQWISADAVLAIGTNSRNLFGDRSTIIYNFSIIRPLEREGVASVLTEQGEKRMAMAGLSFDKITSAGINSAVHRGDSITYTVTVKNHASNIYHDLSFTERLPDGVTLLESSIPLTETDGVLTGKFSIGAHETVVLTYTVKVGQNLGAGTVLCNETAIGGLKMKAIENTVAGYTAAELSAVAAAARAYAESGAEFSDPMELVRAAYTEALGFDPFDGKDALQMEAALFAPTASAKTLDKSGEYIAAVAPHLYGGSELYSADLSGKNDTVRTVYAHHLSVGDVIFCEWLGNYRVLIYLGNGELAAVDSVSLTCSVKQNGSEQWKSSSSRFVQDHYLASLFSYEQFAVLRPSQVAG